MDGVPPHGTLGGTIQWGINTIVSQTKRPRSFSQWSFGMVGDRVGTRPPRHDSMVHGSIGRGGDRVGTRPPRLYCVVIVAIITNASAAFQLQFPPSSDWFIGYFWWASPIPFRAMPYSGTFWGVGSLNAS